MAAQENLSVKEKLRIQEDIAHKDLVNTIINASPADYSALLKKRIDNYPSASELRLNTIVTVDVTAQINQPGPSFLSKLLNLADEPDMYGVAKVSSVVNNLAEHSGSASEALSSLKLRSAYQSPDNQKYYQSLNGAFTKQEARALISDMDVVDLYIIGEENIGPTYSITTHAPTGRIIPPQKDLKYDTTFMKAGLYSEVMAKFETSDRLLVQVNLHLPVDADELFPTQKIQDERERDIQEFISSWREYEFKIFHHGGFYLLVDTSKAHVEAMYLDSRVASIEIGNFGFF